MAEQYRAACASIDLSCMLFLHFSMKYPFPLLTVPGLWLIDSSLLSVDFDIAIGI